MTLNSLKILLALIISSLTSFCQAQQLHLIAVGDNLIHNSILNTMQTSDRTYNFSMLFEVMKSEFEQADLAVINQETILGGTDSPIDGYPNFNSPFAVGTAIAEAGFDVVLHASNHALDVGAKGINNCLNFWKQYPNITILGINESVEQQNTIPIVEKNGIKIALLNYTYGLNGHKMPADQPYLCNLIDTLKIKNDITRADSLADFVIVFPHWGEEYVYQANIFQKHLACLMAESGADLIIGTHPHVLQPVQWIETSNGKRALCFYSIGNYASGQKNMPRVLGGMASVYLEKQNNTVAIASAAIVPLVTHYVWGTKNRASQTYRLSDYTPELAKKHSINASDSTFSIAGMKLLAKQILGDWYGEGTNSF